jgi:TP901 family phage tail tape measure protein
MANLPGKNGIQAFTKWGNQVQWAGRQLQYNFTLPILLAGGAAAKFALDNEKAMTRVIKVYGDGSAAFNQLSKTEIPALGRAFEALSSKFGIAQADAINIAADWAAAGASGLALAKSVKLTMETMILGEMDAASATQALIAIQAQYGQSIDELSQTIDVLNMVENQTGISMEGLVQGFTRAAGVARSAGVDVRHLGAFLAALTPAAGSAANAGNALKTILSRLLAPTKDAAAVMKRMHINVKDLAWQSMNGSQRIEEMAKSFEGLSDAQKAGVSATIASRYQINRFDVLMRDVINVNGYYQKSLESTASATGNYAQRVRELNAVLNSNPQRLKQIWVILQNAMADVIQPMIPVILLLAAELARLVTWFNSLDPSVQKLTLGLLLLLAAIGPIARYVGSVSTLLGILHGVVLKTGIRVVWLGKMFGSLIAGPFGMMGNVIGKMVGTLSVIPKAFSKVGSVAGRALTSGIGSGLNGLSAVVNGFTKPFRAVWTLMLRELGLIWRMTLAGMQGAFVGVGRSLSAIWNVLMGGMLSATGAFRTAFLTIWVATQRAFVVASAGAASALSTVWAGIVAASRLMASGVMASYALAGRGAALMAPMAIFSKVRVFFLTLPTQIGRAVAGIGALFARIGPMIMTGLRAIGPWLLRIGGSWITLAVAAALGIVYAFRKQIGNVFNGVVDAFRNSSDGIGRVFAPVIGLFQKGVAAVEKAFWKLPTGVRDALLTVIKIVQIAAMKVYELFSYLNPFAHHSPSLVEQVTSGMAEIKKQYASVGDVGSVFARAGRDLSAYKNAIAGMGQGPFSDERNDIIKSFPKVLPLFDSLIADMGSLNRVLATQAGAVARQQAVVDKWKKSLDASNAALDREQLALDAAQNSLDKLNQAYADHKSVLDAYATAPLKGMGEMQDAIFANDQAQKKLRLEMLKWEQVNGSIEDVKNNMASLAGSMEQLRGEAADLQSAGAGSDILGPINSQLADMQAAYSKMDKTVQNSPVSDMQKQLDDLQKKGEVLDLENSINFDPMLRQIDKLANAQKELSYGEVVAGIKNEKAAMASLEPQIASATAAVQKQQAAVDAAKASRDAISASYDVESAKLDTLKDSYNQTEDAIRDIESALQDMGSAASQQIAKLDKAAKSAKGAKAAVLTPGEQNFVDAAGANFPDVGGSAKIGREGGLGDQSKLIDDFTKGLTDDISKAFGKFDMFGPVRKKWDEGWAWMEKNVAPKVQLVIDGAKQAWDAAGDWFQGSGLAKGMSDVWDTIIDAGTTAWDWLRSIIDLFKDDFKKVAQEIVKAGLKIWNEIGPELAKFGDLLPGLGKILKVLWGAFKIVATVVGGALLLALKIVSSILAYTLGPVLDLIIGVIKDVIKIVRGLAEVIVGVFTGDWSMAWQGMKDIVSGFFGAIWEIIKGGAKIIWGLIRGLVEGVWDFFKWLYDELVGHSIIPDMINAIIDWFTSLPGKVWDAVKSLVNKMVDVATNAWDSFTKTSSDKWSAFSKWISGLPKDAYNKIIDIKSKLGSAATSAWDWLRSKASSSWSTTISWIKGLPKNAYDNIIDIKNKLGSAATTAWDWLRSKASSSWSTTISWIKGLPKNAYDNIIAIKTKLAEAGRAAFQALVDKAKAIVDGKNGMMTWIAGIPGRIAKALGGVGSAVANAVKNSWNGAAGWLNDNAIGALNKVTSKFGFNMPRLPGFEGGGVIPGRISKKDNTVITARTGEGVIVPELVKALGGRRGLAAANDAARRGQVDRLREMGVQGFANGGIIGKVGSWLEAGAGNALGKVFDAGASGLRKVIPGRPFIEDYLAGNLDNTAKKARQWGDKQEATGNGVLPGTGWKWQVAALKKQFPGIIITSTTRPGAITVSGNSSYHSMGRAVDMAPDMKYFDWIRSTYGKKTKELIYSPAGGKQIKNGQDYMYTGAVRDMHFNHVHWAYDKGGILPRGMTMAYNGTAGEELVLTGADATRLFNVVSAMDRMMSQSSRGTTPGAGSVARMSGSIASLEARLNASSKSEAGTTRGGEGSGTHLNFYGDLSFPNISDGSDAEELIKNLERLA